VLIVPGPFTSVDSDLAGPVHAAHRLLGEVLHAVDILLAYFFALLSVKEIKTGHRECDGEEDEPVPGGQLWPFAEP
jgi:hypothetical protein